MPFQPIVPTWLALNAADDTSPSYFTDLRTGQPVFAGGLNQGDYFDLTNEEANNLSYKTNGILYAGRYRRVKVDSGATAANVKTGTIGLMPSLAVVSTNPLGTKNPPMNIVTSYDQAIGVTAGGVRPVVFLNSITPGKLRIRARTRCRQCSRQNQSHCCRACRGRRDYLDHERLGGRSHAERQPDLRLAQGSSRSRNRLAQKHGAVPHSSKHASGAGIRGQE
jgi:hypothetical protein